MPTQVNEVTNPSRISGRAAASVASTMSVVGGLARHSTSNGASIDLASRLILEAIPCEPRCMQPNRRAEVLDPSAYQPNSFWVRAKILSRPMLWEIRANDSGIRPGVKKSA